MRISTANCRRIVQAWPRDIWSVAWNARSSRRICKRLSRRPVISVVVVRERFDVVRPLTDAFNVGRSASMTVMAGKSLSANRREEAPPGPIALGAVERTSGRAWMVSRTFFFGRARQNRCVERHHAEQATGLARVEHVLMWIDGVSRALARLAAEVGDRLVDAQWLRGAARA